MIHKFLAFVTAMQKQPKIVQKSIQNTFCGFFDHLFLLGPQLQLQIPGLNQLGFPKGLRRAKLVFAPLPLPILQLAPNFELPQQLDPALGVPADHPSQVEAHGDVYGVVAGFAERGKFVLCGQETVDGAFVLDYGPAQLI